MASSFHLCSSQKDGVRAVDVHYLLDFHKETRYHLILSVVLCTFSEVWFQWFLRSLFMRFIIIIELTKLHLVMFLSSV